MLPRRRIKIFAVIQSSDDAARLRFDLSALASRPEENGISLNIGKCKAMSFYEGNIIRLGFTIVRTSLTLLLH